MGDENVQTENSDALVSDDKGGGSSSPQDWDGWLKTQSEDVRKLYDGHIDGLKSALNKERDARKDLSRQLKDLAGKAEQGSDLQNQLNKASADLEEANARADFFEEAATKGVKNPKLAFVVAKQDGLIDGKGRVNWETLKEQYPELFTMAAKPPKGGAGDGTGRAPSAKPSMNSFLRAAAGRSITPE